MAAKLSTIDRPNIVQFFIDDAPIETLDYMDFTRQMPGGHRVNFSRMHLPTPLCTPARIALLTGQLATRTGIVKNLVDGWVEANSVATMLQARGYTTGLFGKYHNVYGGPGVPPGWDRWCGFIDRDYVNYDLSIDGTVFSYGDAPEDYSTDVLAALAAEFMENAPEPWFAYLPLYGPHGAAVPAPRHAGIYAAEAPVRRPNWNPNDAGMAGKPQVFRDTAQPTTNFINGRDVERRRVHEAALSLDEAVELAWDTLVDRGIEDRTWFGHANDNGKFFLEWRQVGKGTPHEENIPALGVVRHPGAPQRETHAITSVCDLAPTYEQLSGGRMLHAVQGQSLVPLLEGDVADQDFRRDLLLSGNLNNGWECLLRYDDAGDLIKYTRWVGTGEVEHYNITDDPYEQANLGPSGVLDRKLWRLRRELGTRHEQYREGGLGTG
jgi:N-acetylglucosamine-6-sulfatase